MALGGFSTLAFGPAVLALGAQQYSERRGGGELDLPLPGTEVRDGDVTFVVHLVQCGRAAPGETTHGRLCELTLTARNDGAARVTVPGVRQQLGGPDGLRLLPMPDPPAPFGTLAPGAAAVAVLTYDLPDHANITHVEVHAGVYSTGGSVALPGPPIPR